MTTFSEIVAASYRAKILTGALLPGTALVSPAVASESDCSTATAKRVLEVLGAQGYIVKVAGRWEVAPATAWPDQRTNGERLADGTIGVLDLVQADLARADASPAGISASSSNGANGGYRLPRTLAARIIRDMADGVLAEGSVLAQSRMAVRYGGSPATAARVQARLRERGYLEQPHKFAPYVVTGQARAEALQAGANHEPGKSASLMDRIRAVEAEIADLRSIIGVT